MSDDSNPSTSSVLAGSEAIAATSDAPENKQSADANGTSANDDVVESSKKVAPESVAPVEALVEQSTNGEQVVAKDVADDKTTNDDEAETKTGAKETDIAPSISESADGPLATPASASKGKGKRKSGGVPEHKSKKLSKKPSKARMTHIDAQPGDYFFIRLKGYPLWPGIIVDEEMLPPLMKKSRPVTGIRADGTYREGYEDGGTKAKDRTFPVMYLHTNEFSWIPNYDLVDMSDEEIADAKPTMRPKDLYQAYLVAGQRHDLEHFKAILEDHEEHKLAEEEHKEQMKALEEKEKLEALEQKEKVKAQKEAKKSKKARVSTAKVVEDEEDVEMEDAVEPESEGAEAPTSAKPKTKKRKNPDGEIENTAQPESVKKPRPTIKLNTPKTTNGTSTPKTAKDPSAPKSAKAKTKKAAKDVPETVAPKKPELSAEEKRATKQKEILFLRHKLQKGLLTRDQEPKEDEMKQMSEFVTKLEGYSDLEVSIIRATKINKVLKAILKLSSIPKEEEFQFKPRSQSLLDKWNKLLASETETPAASVSNGAKPEENSGAGDAKPEPNEPTNGTKESSEEAKTEEKVEALPAVQAADESADQKPVESPLEEPLKENMVESAAVESTA